MTSNANELSARIRQRIDAQDRKLDEIDERKLQAYGERWDAIVNDKLPIIDAAMEQVNGRILDTLRRTEAETETGLGRLHGLLRELGAAAVTVEPRAAPARDPGDLPARDRAGTARPRPAAGADVGRVAPRGSGRDAVRGPAQGDAHERSKDRNAKLTVHRAQIGSRPSSS